MLRITTEKQQVADKLEEKEQKYKKLSETVRNFDYTVVKTFTFST